MPAATNTNVYPLKQGEVRVKVAGKIYERCPEDSCTVIQERHLGSVHNNYMCWDPEGYVFIKYKDPAGAQRKRYLHLYLLEVVEGREIPVKHVVHHIDHNRFNNSVSNLEITTYAHNNAAKAEKKDTTSSYFGVGWHKASGKWLAKITVQKDRVYLGLFEDETVAAKKYDVAFLAVHGSVNGTNKLLNDEEVQSIMADREAYKPKSKKADRALPKHISLQKDVYVVKFGGRGILRRFEEFEEANEFLQKTLQDIETEKEAEMRSKPIQRDEAGVAIIPVRILKTQDYVSARVDDELYYQLVRSPWFIGSQGYPQTNNILMHTVVHPCNDTGKVIDHINTDKLDNRRSNLRHASESINGRNKRKREGCSSRYVGVRKSGARWRAYITYKGEYHSLGTYATEEEASRAYTDANRKLHEKEGVEYIPS